MAEVEREEFEREDECACAICLEEYRAGEEVCWSRSPKCRHVYHRACAEQWLLYHDKCPCCRNNYLEPLHDDNNNEKQYVLPLERSTANPRPFYHHQSLYAREVVTSEEVPPWLMFFWTKKEWRVLYAPCISFQESHVHPTTSTRQEVPTMPTAFSTDSQIYWYSFSQEGQFNLYVIERPHTTFRRCTQDILLKSL